MDCARTNHNLMVNGIYDIDMFLHLQELNRFINLKYLDFAVDKTFNAHTADWNLCVFKKALLLIDHRVLT